jgi:hypothetical protein
MVGRRGNGRKSTDKDSWRGILAGCLALVAAGVAQAATLEAGADQPFKQPSQAVNAAQASDTIRIAPGQYYDCALSDKDNLTIEGAGPDAVLTDTTCTGKALLAVDGNSITIRNLTLQRARVPHHNGAGIRAVGGNLTVENVHFVNNEEGIRSTDNPNASIRIIGSESVHDGACEGACAHGIFVGGIHLLGVEHARFFDTRHAHNIKSRALATEVTDCAIEDGPKARRAIRLTRQTADR